jgi:hypothetical protein
LLGCGFVRLDTARPAWLGQAPRMRRGTQDKPLVCVAGSTCHIVVGSDASYLLDEGVGVCCFVALPGHYLVWAYQCQ